MGFASVSHLTGGACDLVRLTGIGDMEGARKRHKQEEEEEENPIDMQGAPAEARTLLISAPSGWPLDPREQNKQVGANWVPRLRERHAKRRGRICIDHVLYCI